MMDKNTNSKQYSKQHKMLRFVPRDSGPKSSRRGKTNCEFIWKVTVLEVLWLMQTGRLAGGRAGWLAGRSAEGELIQGVQKWGSGRPRQSVSGRCSGVVGSWSRMKTGLLGALVINNRRNNSQRIVSGPDYHYCSWLYNLAMAAGKSGGSYSEVDELISSRWDGKPGATGELGGETGGINRKTKNMGKHRAVT